MVQWWYVHVIPPLPCFQTMGLWAIFPCNFPLANWFILIRLVHGNSKKSIAPPKSSPSAALATQPSKRGCLQARLAWKQTTTSCSHIQCHMFNHMCTCICSIKWSKIFIYTCSWCTVGTETKQSSVGMSAHIHILYITVLFISRTHIHCSRCSVTR